MKKIYISTILLLSLILLSVQEAYADSFKITVSPLSTDFYLEDISGKVAGYYPPSGFIVGELPYIDYYSKNGVSDVENPTSDQQWHELSPNGLDKIIPLGKYKLVVFGNSITTLTQVIMSIYIYKNGNSGEIMPVDYIMPGLTYTYEFEIAAAPTDNNFIFIKTSNPASLIALINALAKEGYIGDTKFVTEITKEINEIEAEKAKGKIDDGMTPAQKAKKEYQELLKELDEKNTKPEKDEYVKDFGYSMIKKDMDYIINHIQ